MILDIIDKKRLGKELSYKELDCLFNGYLNGDVYDYQMSAFLMAVCINGMTDEEVFALTKIFVDSGDCLELSCIQGIKVDKHSTGGIGDKTTFVVAPIVASLGIPFIKMSGRGLGYTGGTIDKLESIKGYKVDLSEKEIIKQVKDINLVITGQTHNLVPMDKIVYALRDVTATVKSIPLIASSIMSKKIASGADKILIDIKVGNGAFLSNKEDGKALGDLMIRIGNIYDREVRYVITDMDTPLGYNIGNGLEVVEAIDVLKGKETDSEFVKICIEIASELASMGLNISFEEAKKLVIKSIEDKSAYKKFVELIEHQGGDIKNIQISKKKYVVKSNKTGIIKKISALEVGKLSLELGAGKKSINDKIDYGVGIRLNKVIGDKVKKGDILATLYVNNNVPIVNIDKIYTII